MPAVCLLTQDPGVAFKFTRSEHQKIAVECVKVQQKCWQKFSDLFVFPSDIRVCDLQDISQDLIHIETHLFRKDSINRILEKSISSGFWDFWDGSITGYPLCSCQSRNRRPPRACTHGQDDRGHLSAPRTAPSHSPPPLAHLKQNLRAAELSSSLRWRERDGVVPQPVKCLERRIQWENS